MAPKFKHLEEVHRVADAMHNRFTIRDLVSAGVPERSAHRMKHRGCLETIEGPVLSVPGRETTFLSRARTGLILAGHGSAGARRTAAQLMGSDGCTDGEPIDIYHPNVRLRSDLFVPSRAIIPPEHITVTHGIPHSDIICTLAQIGAVWPPERVERALEWALRNGTSYAAITAQLGRMGSTGLRSLREVLDLRPPELPVTHSELETRFWQLIRGRIDEMPERQVPVRDSNGRILFYLDLAWWRWRLYVELDGVSVHSTPTAIFSDRRRQNAITALHHLARLDYTWFDVVHRPGYVVANVREALSAARQAVLTDGVGNNPRA